MFIYMQTTHDHVYMYKARLGTSTSYIIECVDSIWRDRVLALYSRSVESVYKL